MESRCYHILAVKLGQGQDVKVDEKNKNYNITKLRKNVTANKKSMVGRKRPQKEDVDAEHNSDLDDLDDVKPSTFKPEVPPEEPLEIEPLEDMTAALSLERDINYSKDVWVPAGGNLSNDLNVTDRDVILLKSSTVHDVPADWLSELIIDSAMELILKDRSLENIGTYQSCGCARDPSFRKQVGPWSVIINTDPAGRGDHWVLCSSVHADQDHIHLFDSAPGGKFSMSVKMAIADIASIKGTYMFIDSIDIYRQQNSKDCGVLAIANMTALAHGLDVKTLKYAKSSVLRNHLIQCFEEKKFLPFPTIGHRKSKGVVNVTKAVIF
jgi:hypothetical protein